MKQIVTLLAVILCGVCFADNLVVNGDMKTNTGWSIWGSAPRDAAIRAKILSYVNEGPNGERVLKIDDMVSDHNPYLIQHIAVNGITPEQKYQISFKAKAAAGQKFCASVQMAAPKKFFGAVSRQFVGTGEWKSYEGVLTKFNAGTKTFGLAFFPFSGDMGNKALTGSLLISDVKLELMK